MFRTNHTELSKHFNLNSKFSSKALHKGENVLWNSAKICSPARISWSWTINFPGKTNNSLKPDRHFSLLILNLNFSDFPGIESYTEREKAGGENKVDSLEEMIPSANKKNYTADVFIVKWKIQLREVWKRITGREGKHLRWREEKQ